MIFKNDYFVSRFILPTKNEKSLIGYGKLLWHPLSISMQYIIRTNDRSGYS